MENHTDKDYYNNWPNDKGVSDVDASNYTTYILANPC
jgi:hypothetical protein